MKQKKTHRVKAGKITGQVKLPEIDYGDCWNKPSKSKITPEEIKETLQSMMSDLENMEPPIKRFKNQNKDWLSNLNAPATHEGCLGAIFKVLSDIKDLTENMKNYEFRSIVERRYIIQTEAQKFSLEDKRLLIAVLYKIYDYLYRWHYLEVSMEKSIYDFVNYPDRLIETVNALLNETERYNVDEEKAAKIRSNQKMEILKETVRVIQKDIIPKNYSAESFFDIDNKYCIFKIKMWDNGLFRYFDLYNNIKNIARLYKENPLNKTELNIFSTPIEWMNIYSILQITAEDVRNLIDDILVLKPNLPQIEKLKEADDNLLKNIYGYSENYVKTYAILMAIKLNLCFIEDPFIRETTMGIYTKYVAVKKS